MENTKYVVCSNFGLPIFIENIIINATKKLLFALGIVVAIIENNIITHFFIALN